MFTYAFKVQYKVVMQAVFLFISEGMRFSVWNFQRHMKAVRLSPQLHHVQRLTFILGSKKQHVFLKFYFASI